MKMTSKGGTWGPLILSFTRPSLAELVAGAQAVHVGLLLLTLWWAAGLVAMGYFDARSGSRRSDWCNSCTSFTAKHERLEDQQAPDLATQGGLLACGLQR